MNHKLHLCFRAIACLVWITQDTWATSSLESRDVVMTQSRAGRLAFRMQAPEIAREETGDCIFPQGGRIEIYDQDETVIITGRAQWAAYYPQEGVCKFKNDVEIRTVEDRKQLNTELLFWEMEKRVFHTEKFVRLETEGKALTGEGFVADQDLERYTLERPQGILERIPEDDSLA